MPGTLQPRLLATAVFLLSLHPAHAQVRFEVASVKLAPAGGMTAVSPPGSARFSAMNVTLDNLIALAYGVDSGRISGLPGWSESQQYDVIAKPEGPGGLNYQQMRPMLQQLLADRLKLAVHREKKLMPGYALVVAKGGPKLQKSAGKSDKRYLLPRGLQCDNASLDILAWMLSQPAGRPVVDRTEIQGKYDIELHYARDDASDNAPGSNKDTMLPSLFTALQEQLGLKLETQKVEVDTVVVDHVERVPAEN
jgi:uncharacterized protein (TIGR03435 family)